MDKTEVAQLAEPAAKLGLRIACFKDSYQTRHWAYKNSQF